MQPLLGTRIEAPTSASTRLSRRQLLVRGALAGGAIVVAGFVVRVAQRFGEGAAAGRKVLSAREERTLSALITAMLPGEDSAAFDPMPAGDPVFILDYVDDFLAGSDPDVRLLFKSTLHVVEEQALLTRFGRFSSLDLATRQAEVRAWELTPTYLKRAAFQSVKMMIAVAYFEQPGPADVVGWYVGCAPPHLQHKSKERLARVRGTS